MSNSDDMTPATSCTDNVKNGGETDVDCGGDTTGCPRCPLDKSCLKGSDCTSNICNALTLKCVADKCNDGIKDGNESDVDCGMACPTLCAVGKMCGVGGDCLSSMCSGGICQPTASCMNGVKDGMETDIDCGGPMCAKCPSPKACGGPNDCLSGNCASSVCQPCPTDMVAVAKPATGYYCVNRTETTQSQFAQFLATSPSLANQSPVCIWNTSYSPSTSCTSCFYDPTNYPTTPVIGVDWCDASAYCKWAGKRLCGKIGGGSVAFTSQNDPAQDEWNRACSAAGTLAYPYGNTYSGSTCSTKDKGYTKPIAVGYLAGCVGGYAGIYDMSGNVMEWEDSCNGTAGAADLCHARGGNYLSMDVGSLCSMDPYYTQSSRNSQFVGIGFRCCADAQ